MYKIFLNILNSLQINLKYFLFNRFVYFFGNFQVFFPLLTLRFSSTLMIHLRHRAPNLQPHQLPIRCSSTALQVGRSRWEVIVTLPIYQAKSLQAFSPNRVEAVALFLLVTDLCKRKVLRDLRQIKPCISKPKVNLYRKLLLADLLHVSTLFTQLELFIICFSVSSVRNPCRIS